MSFERGDHVLLRAWDTTNDKAVIVIGTVEAVNGFEVQIKYGSDYYTFDKAMLTRVYKQDVL